MRLTHTETFYRIHFSSEDLSCPVSTSSMSGLFLCILCLCLRLSSSLFFFSSSVSVSEDSEPEEEEVDEGSVSDVKEFSLALTGESGSESLVHDIPSASHPDRRSTRGILLRSFTKAMSISITFSSP